LDSQLIFRGSDGRKEGSLVLIDDNRNRRFEVFPTFGRSI
jgi:hypothetical protein